MSPMRHRLGSTAKPECSRTPVCVVIRRNCLRPSPAFSGMYPRTPQSRSGMFLLTRPCVRTRRRDRRPSRRVPDMVSSESGRSRHQASPWLPACSSCTQAERPACPAARSDVRHRRRFAAIYSPNICSKSCSAFWKASADNLTDLALRLGSVINPFSWRRSNVAQSKDFQAETGKSFFSLHVTRYIRASVASSTLSLLYFIFILGDRRGSGLASLRAATGPPGFGILHLIQGFGVGQVPGSSRRRARLLRMRSATEGICTTSPSMWTDKEREKTSSNRSPDADVRHAARDGVFFVHSARIPFCPFRDNSIGRSHIVMLGFIFRQSTVFVST